MPRTELEQFPIRPYKTHKLQAFSGEADAQTIRLVPFFTGLVGSGNHDAYVQPSPGAEVS